MDKAKILLNPPTGHIKTTGGVKMRMHHPETNIQKVANFFIWFGQKHGDPVSHLKLQKLCYYAEAYYWAIYNRPLTGEPFEAWTHGPVSRRLWNSYKDRGWEPICEPTDKPDLPQEITKYLDEIAEVFFGYNAFQLERITHHDEPWKKARGGLPIEAKCENPISPASMREYYKRYVKEA
jgi:uncharacterized phage-associated protein